MKAICFTGFYLNYEGHIQLQFLIFFCLRLLHKSSKTILVNELTNKLGQCFEITLHTGDVNLDLLTRKFYSEYLNLLAFKYFKSLINEANRISRSTATA